MRGPLLLVALVSACVALYFYLFPVLYWADADSGRWNGIEFRLSNVDSAEVSHPNSAFGPAGCFEEQALGKAAEEWIKAYTKDHSVRITGWHAMDRHGRFVVTMATQGQDIGATGTELGHFQEWQWENRRPWQTGKPKHSKPNWCELG